MAVRPVTAKSLDDCEKGKPMDFAAFNWMLLTGVGVALLLLAIAYAKLRNRSSRQVIEKSERATHDVYDEEDRIHRDDGNGRV
jgi:hypothetical protein